MEGTAGTTSKKALKAKSKDSLKASLNTSSSANKQTQEIVMALQLKKKEQGTQQVR